MAIISPIRAMTVKELIAELSTYPPGMPVYLGASCAESFQRENLHVTRRAPHDGGPAVLAITYDSEGTSCAYADECMHFMEA